MPDNLFSPLGEGPVPPMAGAADIRARGDQRQRRSRVALAGTGALAVLLAGAVAVSATGRGDRDEVLPGQPVPSPQDCPDAGASTDPRCAPPAPTGLRADLLTPVDVEQVRGGSWSVRQTDDLPFPVLPAGCRDGEAIGGPDGAPGSNAVGTFLNGSDGDVIGHILVEYRDEATAIRSLGTLIDAVEACEGQVPGWTVVGGLPSTSPDRVYGELVRGSEREPYAVERLGAVLSAVQVRSVRLEQMPALAEVAIRRVAERQPQPPQAPVPSGPATFDVTAAFLSPEAAGAAELPGWSVDESYTRQAGPLLDPCDDGGALIGGSVRASGERSMGSVREAGGSTLVQEVYAYVDERAAAAALEVYADRLRACPISPVPEVSDTVTSDLVVSEADRLLVRNRYCNPACTDIFTTYAYVVQVGTGVTVATYAVGEDGDPADDARALLDPIAAALARAVDAG